MGWRGEKDWGLCWFIYRLMPQESRIEIACGGLLLFLFLDSGINHKILKKGKENKRILGNC